MSGAIKEFETHITLMNGRIRVRRCQALSKRSKVQCKKAALRGKRQCAMHCGRLSGPKSDAGKKRCAAAKTVHGWETREKRIKRSEKLRELRQLEKLMHNIGMLK